METAKKREKKKRKRKKERKDCIINSKLQNDGWKEQQYPLIIKH